MNEAQIAVRPRVRALEAIYADMEAQRGLVEYLKDLACGFYDCDTRPMIVSSDACQRVGPDPVPLDLREHLKNEAARLADLEYEYRRTRRAEA